MEAVMGDLAILVSDNKLKFKTTKELEKLDITEVPEVIDLVNEFLSSKNVEMKFKTKSEEDFMIEKITQEVKESTPTIFRQLAKDFYEIQPYFYDRSGQWWLWNKTDYLWEVRDNTDIMNQFDKHFNQESEKSNLKTSILEALRKYGRLNEPEDIKPTWIQFKKQIYDIESDKMFEATPKYFSANPIPWKVGETEDTPNIDRLFKSWVKEEDMPKLYELFAFTLVPQMFIHSFHFLYSPPGMGKSTYVNLLIRFIGEKNKVSTSISRINANPRFETRNWHRKLLITMSEVSNMNELKNSGLINQATGEDTIFAEVKGSPVGFDYVNYGKFIFPTNKLLKVDSDDGFGRRVRTLKFQTKFEKEKDILSTITDNEFENLSKKCIRIAKELYQSRRFTGDVDITERMTQYQEDSKTDLERFIDNECDTSDYEDKILLDKFLAKFNVYLKSIGVKQIIKQNLGKELKKLEWEVKRELVEDSFGKKDLKAFILGVNIRHIRVSPESHLDSHVENELEQACLPDMPDNEDKIQSPTPHCDAPAPTPHCDAPAPTPPLNNLSPVFPLSEYKVMKDIPAFIKLDGTEEPAHKIGEVIKLHYKEAEVLLKGMDIKIVW